MYGNMVIPATQDTQPIVYFCVLPLASQISVRRRALRKTQFETKSPFFYLRNSESNWIIAVCNDVHDQEYCVVVGQLVGDQSGIIFIFNQQQLKKSYLKTIKRALVKVNKNFLP